MANVGGDSLASDFEAYCMARWSLQPSFVKVSKHLAGVRNTYEDINELGIDRWLAVVAAWQRYRKTVCVIDCGTALTIDIVDHEGVYIGGYIIPGLDMMAAALKGNTEQIKVSREHSPAITPGINTTDCVIHGARIACVAAVNRVLSELRDQCGKDVEAILTGGGAEQIKEYIQHEVELEPWLVLQGLRLQLGENP